MSDLRKAIMRAEDGAGTLPAKDAVKLRPADWHKVCKLGREAADEIDRLTAALAEAQKDRDYWKVEAEGEAAKVAFRDERMFNFHAEDGELLFEIPRRIAVSIEPDGVGYTIFDPETDRWKPGSYDVAKEIEKAGAEIARALKEKP